MTSRQELVEYIAKRTMGKEDTTGLVNEVASYLLQEKMTSELDSLMRDVIEYRANNGIVEGTVAESPG